MVNKEKRYGSKPTTEEPEKKDKPAATPAPTSVDSEELKKAKADADKAKQGQSWCRKGQSGRRCTDQRGQEARRCGGGQA